MHKKESFYKAYIMVVLGMMVMVIACIYHFHDTGFGLGLVGFVLAVISIYTMHKDNKKQR